MHDPDFDGLTEKKGKTSEAAAIPIAEPSDFRPRGLLLRVPVPRLAQAVFAEALRHALIENIPADRAVELAADVNPSRRFRNALMQMARNICSGYPIDLALEKTGINVQLSLLAALRIGEQNGCLPNELASYARRVVRFSSGKFLRAIGRSEEASEFATALSRLLRDRHLTVQEVRAAGELADNGKGRFKRVVEDVARRMTDGESLPHAMSRHPEHFDRLLCALLESTNSRQELKACLERLAER